MSARHRGRRGLSAGSRCRGGATVVALFLITPGPEFELGRCAVSFGPAGPEPKILRDSISEWRPRLLRFRHSLMVAMISYATVSSDSSSAFQARLSSCLTLTWSCVCAISPLTLHAAIMCQLLVSPFTVFTHSSLPSHALGAQFPSFICTALIPRIHVHYRFDVVHTPL